ncbi:hypothetical protein ACFSQJ_18790 [Croceitalea marina]|uniref:Uncharacterized protein n=2 Tax=Croceitalea marina TaxID=1775166 RepID=A0ABW5N297_9FLAO
MALSDLSCKQRLAFHTGITITSLEESNKREDFFNRVSWMIGGSYKAFTQATRLNTGVILYNKIDAISGDKSLGFAPYFGLSIDLEIGKWIQKSIPSIGGNFKN